LSTGTLTIIEYVLLFGVVIAVMIFTTILPQRRRDRDTKATLDKVRRGARVVTSGGIHGMVTEVQDDIIVLRIAEKVEIRVAKSAVVHVVRSADTEPAEAAEGGRKGRRQG